MRRYSDAQLVDAISASRSWRGVLRSLGLAATSASAMRSVRLQADRLGLDYTHFTGRRRWTDRQLADAVEAGKTWSQVAESLGLAGGSSTTTLKGHAARLGLDTAHLSPVPATLDPSVALTPDPVNLPRAGALLAAAWFELCGLQVAWPLEPCRYDLLVWRSDRAERIQVKTARVKTGSSWTVWLSTTGRNRPERRPYDPDEIDHFFVIDGNLDCYNIPAKVVGGRMAIQLSAYREFRVAKAWSA